METLRRLIEVAKLKSKSYKIWQTFPETPESLAEMPFKVGPASWSGVLLEEEVYVHLGDFSTPSTAFVIATTEMKSVHDGQITLIGPDLSLISQQTIPFALGIILGIKKSTSELVVALNRSLQVTDEIEGVVQRSQRGDPRFLLGKVIAERGISFQHLGRAFLHLFRSKFPREIQKSEIFFLTMLPSMVTELKQFREQVGHEIEQIWQDKIRQVSKQRTDCDFDWECEVCEYQRICEELRDIIKLRKQNIGE